MLVLGLMSGTSLDGLDLALVNFYWRDGEIQFELQKTTTIPYPKYWFDKLKNAHTLSTEELNRLDEAYGTFLTEVVGGFLKKTQQQPELIASHGHTVLHQPHNGITLQIGNGPQLFNALKIPVVCDFRGQDVNLGGQGAPLVPIGDRLLFSEYDACVNLGGFVNISYENGPNREAYDVSPMNIVLNDLVSSIGLGFDSGGELSRKGELDESLLSALNALEFYKEKPPKSLGKEWVLDNIDPILKGKELSIALRTFTEHAAIQLANSLNQHKRVLLTGGGVYNQFFMERLKDLTHATIVVPNAQIVEYKEALIFALLGYLKWQGYVNVLSSVTGASADHSSGVVYK